MESEEERGGEPRISPQIRKQLFDDIIVRFRHPFGSLDDVQFLARIHDLAKYGSHDYRFRTAEADIRQHTVNNDDWEPDWFLTDSRFNYLHKPDTEFLKLLTEMLHHRVRPSAEDRDALMEIINNAITPCGFKIAKKYGSGGLPVYVAQLTSGGEKRTIEAARHVADILSSDYLRGVADQLERALVDSPSDAIGKSKDLVEAVAKEIVKRKEQTAPEATIKFPALVKKAARLVPLVPPGPEFASARDPVELILKGLGVIIEAEAALRNDFGSGHGKDPAFQELATRHATLAAHAATAIAEFLLRSYLVSED